MVVTQYSLVEGPVLGGQIVTRLEEWLLHRFSGVGSCTRRSDSDQA